MKIAVTGRTETLYQSGKHVADGGHDIPIVVTCEAEPHYRADADDFEELASELDADFIKTTAINSDEMVEIFKKHGCEVAISVNWKTVIRQRVLDCFDHGIINCHAGDLPRFRGNAATNWAIIAGEDEIVYTLHFMNEQLDAGPILVQRSMPISSETTISDVYEFGHENVPEMFLEAVNGLTNGTLQSRPQPDDPDQALRCCPRHPKDSELDWMRPATHLNRIVRASSEPLFGAYTHFNGEKLRIWKAHVEEPATSYLGTPGQVAECRPDSGEVAVITGEDFLVLEEVEAGDRGRTTATEIITSNRARLGMDVTGEIDALRERLDDTLD